MYNTAIQWHYYSRSQTCPLIIKRCITSFLYKSSVADMKLQDISVLILIHNVYWVLYVLSTVDNMTGVVSIAAQHRRSDFQELFLPLSFTCRLLIPECHAICCRWIESLLILDQIQILFKAQNIFYTQDALIKYG